MRLWSGERGQKREKERKKEKDICRYINLSVNWAKG
jgi:hypothetical protein